MRKLYVLLLLISPLVMAADPITYFWTSNQNSLEHSSPESACDYQLTISKTYFPSAYILSLLPRSGNHTVWDCKINRIASNGTHQAYSYSTLTRAGDSCPSGSYFNVNNGKCEGDPCLPTVGQYVKQTHLTYPTEVSEAGFVAPPPAVCENSCNYDKAPKDGKSVWRCDRQGTETEPAGTLCDWWYKGTGTACSVGSSAPPVASSRPPMKQEQSYIEDHQCDSWTTDANGVKTRNCLTTNTFKEPGDLNCGEGPNGFVCVPGTPSPYYKDKDKTETTSEKVNPDGSKETSTATTTTTTTCKGVSPCVTTSTSSSTVTGTNPDGTPGDSEETCTGSGCGEEELAEEEGEDAPPPTFTGIEPPGDQGTFDDAASDWDEKIADAKEELKGKVEQLGGTFSGSLNLGTGGSLYCGDSVTVLGEDIDFCLNKYSSELSLLSMMMLFIGAVIALFIVFK